MSVFPQLGLFRITLLFGSSKVPVMPLAGCRAIMVASYSTTYKGEYNLGSGGDDIINGGDGTDVCIGGQGENTFSNCETMH
jgi:hypothetical protein